MLEGYLNKSHSVWGKKRMSSKGAQRPLSFRIKFRGDFLTHSWSGSVVSETFPIQRFNTMTLASQVFGFRLTPFMHHPLFISQQTFTKMLSTAWACESTEWRNGRGIIRLLSKVSETRTPCALRIPEVELHFEHLPHNLTWDTQPSGGARWEQSCGSSEHDLKRATWGSDWNR